jgi:hypothetical protein
MTDDPIEVELALPGATSATIRRLDETTVALAASDPEAFRASSEPVDASGSSLAVALPPFGLVTLDLELPS